MNENNFIYYLLFLENKEKSTPSVTSPVDKIENKNNNNTRERNIENDSQVMKVKSEKHNVNGQIIQPTYTDGFEFINVKYIA